jgi:hypothetical protein
MVSSDLLLCTVTCSSRIVHELLAMIGWVHPHQDVCMGGCVSCSSVCPFVPCVCHAGRCECRGNEREGRVLQHLVTSHLRRARHVATLAPAQLLPPQEAAVMWHLHAGYLCEVSPCGPQWQGKSDRACNTCWSRCGKVDCVNRWHPQCPSCTLGLSPASAVPR